MSGYTRRKSMSRTRKVLRRYRPPRSGGMNITRNTLTYYIAPGPTLGTPLQAGGATLWTLGGATASGGLVAGLYDLPFSKAFQLNDCVASGDLQALFDAYMISKVVIYASITTMASTGAPGAGASMNAISMLSNPTLYYYNDYDDNIVPSASDVRERMGVRSKQLIPGRKVRITCRPRSDVPIYNASGVLVGAGIGKAKSWLDIASSNIPHYGVKGCLANMDLRPNAGTPGYQVTFDTKYFLKLKDVR